MDNMVLQKVWQQGQRLTVDDLSGCAFTGENAAHTFEISGKNASGTVPISGTIAGKFLRSDNVTVPVTGTASDGVASITLTEDCYAVPGRFIFSVYANDGTHNICIYCGVGNVLRTDSGEYEGGEIITDVTALINAIETAVATIPADYSELLAGVAPSFSSSTAYTAGQYVWYPGLVDNVGALYRFTADHAAGSWTGTDAVSVSLSGDLGAQVTDVKSAFVQKSIGEYGTLDIGELTSGKYILQSNGFTANSSAWSITNFVPVVPGSCLMMTCPLSDNETQIEYVASIAFYTSNNYNSFKSSKPVQSGTLGDVKWVVYDIPNDATHFKASIYTASASNYKYINILPISENIKTNTANITELNGLYAYEGTFTTSGQILNTGIAVKNGHVYTITAMYTADDFSNGQINIFSNGSGGSANYVAVLPDLQQRDFVCGVDGYLCLYNIFGYIGTVSVGIVENISRANQKMGVTYYVGQYEREKSLTALLLKLKNDKSPKTIIIRGGDYDIFSEYKALQQSGDLLPVPESGYNPATQYVPYNVFIPDNTHIVGEGLVRLNYMPTVSQTSSNEAKTLSPINVAGSMTLENVEINCKNGRYCIHDDPVQDPSYNGAIKKYINVRCTKYTNDDANYGTPHNFGCGVSRAMRYEFDNCYFESKSSSSSARTLYFHDRIVVGGVELQEKMSSNIVVKNTIIKSTSGNLAVYFGNIGATGLNIRVDVNSCWTNGNIVSADENSAGTTGNNSNSFNIKTLLSHYNSIIVRDANNAYPPQEFGLE